ncbi:MAG: Na+/H+ antiporter NhaC [Saprospiraceae bacterium]|nr:Na+/H+ antiporter NhaC [Saprospiraceae bacterium]
MEPNKIPPLKKALIPIVFLILMLSFNVIFVYGDDSISGSNQMILILSGAVAAIVGYTEGYTWKSIIFGIVQSIGSTVPAMIILLLIGALAGTWLISGVVPAMIYYGLQILHPSIFLVATCIICSVVSVATGSSWSTVATVGIALFGIGKTLGFSDPMVAGAIISGAYFGDKISPLSDTTNLAPAMAGTDLFTHIRYMIYTTIPSYIITLIVFIILGLGHESQGNNLLIQDVITAIEANFNIHLGLFIVPLAVIFMIIKKTPAIPALLAGALLGGIFAVIFQPELIRTLGGEAGSFALVAYKVVMDAMTVATSIPTENELLASLLGAKGMNGMLGTIWLIIAAMIFGGIMESCGFLKSITNAFISMAKTTASLIGTTAATCISINVLASDQYLSIVVPGRMYAQVYRERGLKPENLSRTLEDAGTVTSVLVPWNTCGAYVSGVLGVATLAYLPFCIFNLISPIMTFIFAVFQIKIAKYSEEERAKIAAEDASIPIVE